MSRRQKYPQPVQEHKISIKHVIKAKNYSQELYLEALKEAKLTICSGPAGSGKTYLVTAVALQKLLNNEIDKILLTRPVVEAGENLGFLPGTLEEKLHPYLLPLLDAIEDHVGPTMLKKLTDAGKIEVAPLAYMRGRSINNAFVILDEAQNATPEQVKMFVTRMGFNSFFAVNGDPAQSDLPHKNGENGIDYLRSRLTGVSPDIMTVEFSKNDIVRNELISTILTHLDAPTPSRVNGKSHSFNLPRGGFDSSVIRATI